MHTRHRAAVVTLAALALLAVTMAPVAAVLVIDSGTSFVTQDGLNATTTGEIVVNGVDFIGNDTVRFRPQVRLQSDSTASIGVENLTGDFYEFEDADGSTNAITQNFIQTGDRVVIASDVDALDINRNSSGSGLGMAPSDGVTDFEYSDTSSIDLTVGPFQPGLGLCAVDISTNTKLQCNTVALNANLELDGLDSGTHSVELMSAQAPVITDPKPSDGVYDADRSVILAANISDMEFPNDEVFVNFNVNGNTVFTDSVTSDDRVFTNAVSLRPGQNTWRVEAVDEAGLTARTRNFTINAAGVIELRNASDNTIIDDTTVDATFFTNGGTETTQTSDGTVELTGLPDEDMRVDLEPQANYTDARFRISTPGRNWTIQLTPTGAGGNTSTIRFELDDQTGDFPPANTTLTIDRSINGNWSTVHSESFGASNYVETDLEENVTYRLSIRNNQGDSRVLQTYTVPTVDTTETLVVSDFNLDPDEDEYLWDARFVEINDSTYIRFEYADPDNATTNLELAIYERNNRTNNTIALNNWTGPIGNASLLVELNDTQQNTTWVVDWTANRDDERIAGSRILGGGSLGPGIDMPQWVKEWMAVAFLVLTSVLFGGLRLVSYGGVAIPAFGAVFWAMGWLPAETSGLAVAVSAMIGLITFAYSANTGADTL